MSKAQVVAAVIQDNGRFLLGKRSPWKKSAPGYWCPISGQIELGETEEHAVVREVREEVGLAVTAVRKVGEFDSNDGKALIHWWLVKIEEGHATLANDEHSELRWVTVEEMKSLVPVFKEDIELFEQISRSKHR